VARLPEVRVITVDGQRVTVVADRALAKTCVHVSALLDDTNARLFFGAPYSASVIDNVSAAEAARLMSHARTLYARRDLLEAHGDEEQKTGDPRG
jgi:hypothetical protein